MMMVISCDYTDAALSQDWKDKVDGGVLEILGTELKFLRLFTMEGERKS